MEIYGLGTDESYSDYSNFGKGNFLWMMRAAITEWASHNRVNIAWIGSYNPNQILTNIAAGSKPDIVFAYNAFPQDAQSGLLSLFTDAEYAKLAAVCGNPYLDVLNYKNQSCGVVYPWNNTQMCYYNRSMFEDYGVKTPLEYFVEGKWTWENFYKCMQEMTKDTNADGKIDTYGLTGDSWGNLVNPWAMDENGCLISTIDTPWMQDFFQMKYDAFSNQYSIDSKNNIQKNTKAPMFAMQLSECCFYDFTNLYKTLSNGDKLEVVPLPRWVGENGESIGFTQMGVYAMHLLASCDEREAAVDLMAYLLQCGIKYMCDYSMGALECQYAGILGTCDLSATWRKAFAGVLTQRAKDLVELDNYNPELIGRIIFDYQMSYWSAKSYFNNMDSLTNYQEIIQMPPDSSIPIIRAKYQAVLDAYNAKYVK